MSNAKITPEDEQRFPEEDMPMQLSERDAKKLLEMLENPPKPNAVAKRAAERFKKDYGCVGHRPIRPTGRKAP
ncbi:MAG TPA: DUF1778 domain-containing protein [Gemmataceae bacterium]|nr:DUF1778 domain-containing protein [Gemmataceae bacterium]